MKILLALLVILCLAVLISLIVLSARLLKQTQQNTSSKNTDQNHKIEK